jgi:malonate transporter and related proteins
MFLSTVIIAWRGSDQLADTAIMGLNASYPNTGFMGFPLAMALFGHLSLPLTLIAIIITVSVIFALAIVLSEIGIHSVRDPSRILAAASRSLITNPLIVAPAFGAIFSIVGVTIPAPLDVFIKLLSTAASPCALVALGLFLAERPVAAPRVTRTVVSLSVAKLAIHPAIAWIIAATLRLPESTIQIVVVSRASNGNRSIHAC